MIDDMRWRNEAFLPFVDGDLTAERRILQLREHIGQHAIPGSERHEASHPGVVPIITFDDATIRLSPDPNKTYSIIPRSPCSRRGEFPESNRLNFFHQLMSFPLLSKSSHSPITGFARCHEFKKMCVWIYKAAIHSNIGKKSLREQSCTWWAIKLWQSCTWWAIKLWQ